MSRKVLFMTSYIISAADEPAKTAKLQELCSHFSIDIFDQTFIKPEKETSIGIEVIKKLQEKAMLKPLRGKEKAIIITQSELLTVPAQNALLKLLEEPPNHTYFFLLTNSIEIFLPTILSRCQIIKITGNDEVSDEQAQQLTERFTQWQDQSIGDALKTAEKLGKDKESTLELLKKMIGVGSAKLQRDSREKKDISRLADQLRALYMAHRTLNSTNTNPRLTLEHLFLDLRIS